MTEVKARPHMSIGHPPEPSAIERMHVHAATPDEKVFVDLTNRSQVRISFAPGYYETASAPDIERQIVRLAKVAFARRMKEYYQVRSADFDETFTRESPPTTMRDHEYVRARSELVAEGSALDGRIQISVIGMQHWSVRIEHGITKTVGEQAFAQAISEAATQLVTGQFDKIRQLKREIYTSYA